MEGWGWYMFNWFYYSYTGVGGWVGIPLLGFIIITRGWRMELLYIYLVLLFLYLFLPGEEFNLNLKLKKV